MDVKNEEEEKRLWGIIDKLDLEVNNNCSWFEICLATTSGIGFMVFSLFVIYIVYRLSTKG